SYTEDGFEIRAVYHDGQPKANSKVFVTYVARDTFSRGPHPTPPSATTQPSDPTSDPDGPPDTTTEYPPEPAVVKLKPPSPTGGAAEALWSRGDLNPVGT